MRLDLHAHTKYSADGTVEPESYLKIAKRNKLDGFAVTDHNEIKGANKAYQLSRKKKKIIIIRGIEISSLSGHILGFGVTEPIPRGLTSEETIEKITDAGGVSVAAHPFRLASGVGSYVVKKAKFSNIEVLNHRSPRHENNRAMRLANELGTGKIGGSDAHFDWELGLAMTEFELQGGTEDDIISELSKKRMKPVGESSTYIQGLKMYGKLMVHWLKRGFRRV
jgi:predicted metal-dependent phosphoesterase TrpH